MSKEGIEEADVIVDIPEVIEEELRGIDFLEEGKDPQELTRFLLDKVYPYRMKGSHPRYFCFIPSAVSPYSIFGDFINSIHNPYGGGYNISKGTANIERETLKWMGEMAGYDVDKLGGQFVSGGSMANLTASIVARDKKLKPEEFFKGRVYVSDQTHSSVAKGIHIMGLPRENVRKVPTNDKFEMIPEELEEMIKADIEAGYKPFLIVGTSGTTNTGAIDPLHELADIAEKYDLWYHIDGAYGATVLLSSHKELLSGIERSDSLSWDGHKWLFQTYGCAVVLCKDKKDMLDSFSVDPEYLKDVESTEENLNFWDLGVELTKPVRSMRLWFTLQTVGLETMRAAIDQGFQVADWLEEEVNKHDNLEIVSHSQLGIVNFRYRDDEHSERELDEINRRISQRALNKNYAAFITTELNGKIVLRFCCNNALTTREEIRNIMNDIQMWIAEEAE